MAKTEKHQQPSLARLTASIPGHWSFEEARSRFGELVRAARVVGPQFVAVDGCEVVVIAADEFHRLQGGSTGQALIDCLDASPHREEDLVPARYPMPVRAAPWR